MKNLIKRHEGVKYRPYKCSQGFLTIGVGRNLDAAPLPRHMAAQLAKSGFITPDMVEELFEMDLQSALRSCRRVWPGFDGFSAARQNALADFMFNLGEGGRASAATGYRIITLTCTPVGWLRLVG